MNLIRKTLIKAAGLINERGLEKGYLETKNGFCINGALNMAMHDSSGYKRVSSLDLYSGELDTEPCLKAIGKFLGFNSAYSMAGQIADWNNFRLRTKEEVVAVLVNVAAIND